MVGLLFFQLLGKLSHIDGLHSLLVLAVPSAVSCHVHQHPVDPDATSTPRCDAPHLPPIEQVPLDLRPVCVPAKEP